MSDYTKSKVDNRSAYPENAIDAHEWQLYEHVLTPAQLKSRFLWGIPLVSNIVDPITRMPERMTDEFLQDQILRAVGLVQLETGIDIFPVKRSEKKPFDRQEMIDLGYIRTHYRPIRSVDKLTIAPGDSPDILTISPDWISKEGFVKGEVRIIPTIGTLTSGYIPSSSGVGQGSAFVAIMGGGREWVASFWTIEYTTGFDSGLVPKPLNELIGCTAAIEILSLLATTNRSNSRSLGIDGMSQSVSDAGPQIYQSRIEMLTNKKDFLSKRFRAKFGQKWTIGNI